MDSLKDIRIGFVSYYKSLEFILVNNLWFYFLFPAVLALILFFTGDAIRGQLQSVNFNAIDKEDYYQMLIVGLKGVFVFVAFKLNKVVLLIVLSPILALLSAKTEKLLAGNTYPFTFQQFAKDINRGISIAVRNAMVQLVFIGLWLSLCLFVGELLDYTWWFIFFLGFYFYGFSLIDYINERRKVNMEESILFVRKHFGLTLIIGGLFSTFFLIPIAGVIIAPITGIVAATLGVHAIVDLKKDHSEEKEL